MPWQCPGQYGLALLPFLGHDLLTSSSCVAPILSIPAHVVILVRVSVVQLIVVAYLMGVSPEAGRHVG